MRIFPRLATPDDSAPKLAQLTAQTDSQFIPEAEAAVCCDCAGLFLYRAGSCPGCGSRSWVLLKPSAWFTKAMQDTQRRVK